MPSAFGIYDKMLPVSADGAGLRRNDRDAHGLGLFDHANGGKQIKPSLIDRIQDRYGKTVFKHDERGCDRAAMRPNGNQPEPELVDNREQVLDPMTAYQITSMMEGVCSAAPAPASIKLGPPRSPARPGRPTTKRTPGSLATRPTSSSVSIMGYDTPRGLGHGATGGGLAAPVFKDFMRVPRWRARPDVDFKVPEGMNLVAINRKTGMRCRIEGDPGTIIEAFKPGTGPADSYSVIGMGADGSNPAGRIAAVAAGQQAIQSRRRRAVLTIFQRICLTPAHFALHKRQASLCHRATDSSKQEEQRNHAR
jgi:penicillin-binding protein 1A